MRSDVISPPVTACSRRAFLNSAARNLGVLALGYLLQRDGLLPAASRVAGGSADPLALKAPHHAPRAKSVIWLFMEGGPSHIDLFDPKPELERLAGQVMPESFGKVMTAMGTEGNSLMPSTRKWRQYGESGAWISDLYPSLPRHVDDLAVVRSCWADHLNHVNAVWQMNTGSTLAGRPAMGSWVTYGLGAANQNLPTFVVLTDDRPVNGGAKNWSAGFLPATYQGTAFRQQGPPILHLMPPETIGANQQRSKLDFLSELDRLYATDNRNDEIAARVRSYELAFQMQTAAPEAVDLSQESDATTRLYGMDNELTAKFGSNCLLARRLVERGVRFVEVYCGSGSGWDAHTKLDENHEKMCAISDRPIAGLLADLKSRGLLEQTLVVWGGEFGRTPFTQNAKGRDHNPWGFTMWMAGGGVKRGQVVGTTDAIGLRAVDRPCHIHDIHATVLHLLGLNHMSLTYLHNGRAERPTINAGEVIEELL